MKVVYHWLWIVLTALALLVQLTRCKKDKAVFCSVCRGLVAEINGRISEADPEKTVLAGSYRMDARGNQNLAQVKYATSVEHLTEILDDVCEAFDHYAIFHDLDFDRDVVVRTKSRSGKELDTSNVRVSRQLRRTFKDYCDELIEDHENEIMTIFKREDRETIEDEFCGQISAACTEEELTIPVPVLPEKLVPGKIQMAQSEGGTLRPLEGVETLQDIRRKIMESALGGEDGADDNGDCDAKDEF